MRCCRRASSVWHTVCWMLRCPSQWSALAITECETWEHRRHWRLFTGRGHTDGAFVGCQGDHHPVTVGEMRRTPRVGQFASSADLRRTLNCYAADELRP